MPRRIVALLLGLAIPFSCAAEDKKPTDKKPNTAIVPTKKQPDRHAGFLKDIEKMGTINVVFIGDSITDGWRKNGAPVWKEHFTPLKTLNLGIGGDRTEHVLWRLQNGELDGYMPKAFMIMIGTNNMGANSEAEIAEGVKAIISEIHKKHSTAKVLLLGIFPRSPKPTDGIRAKVKRTNELIAKFDDGKLVKYLDIGEKFLEPDGTLAKPIMYDFLHLTEKGYGIWADAVKGPLAEMLK